jgi:predicted ester cyclase
MNAVDTGDIGALHEARTSRTSAYRRARRDRQRRSTAHPPGPENTARIDDRPFVLRFTNSGTNVGPFLNNPPTGKHAEWVGIGIYTVSDGCIIDAWFSEDILGMLIQLDAVALPA